MTDNEIIGAMYYCRDFDSCNINCPFNNKGLDCESIISKYALDRIGRQQAEIELKTMDIESLTNERNALEEMVKEQQAEIERLSRPCFVLNHNSLSDKEMKKALKENPMTIVPVDNYTIKRIDEEGIRAEAIKEFAERLKEKISASVYTYWNYSDGGYYLAEDCHFDIDDLVEEMTEVQE